MKIVVVVAALAACGVCGAADETVRASQFGWTGVGFKDITGALEVEGPKGRSRITADELMRRHPFRPELRTFAPSSPETALNLTETGR